MKQKRSHSDCLRPTLIGPIKDFRFAIDTMCFVAVRTFHFLGKLDGFRLYHALTALTYSKHKPLLPNVTTMEALFLILMFKLTHSKHMLLLQNVNSMKAFFLKILFILKHSKHTLDGRSNIKCRRLQLQRVNIQPTPNSSTSKMPSRYQYTPPVEPTDDETRLALARFRGFITQMGYRAVLSRISQGDDAANAQHVIDSFLLLRQGDLDQMFGVLAGMPRFQAPATAPTQLDAEPAVINWPLVNGNASGNEAAIRTQASMIPNGTLPNGSSTFMLPDGTLPLSPRARAGENSSESSAPRESVVNSDSDHVRWNDTPTPTDSGENTNGLGSAVAPAQSTRAPMTWAALASGARRDPQRDSTAPVDAGGSDTPAPGRASDGMIPTSTGGSENNLPIAAPTQPCTETAAIDRPSVNGYTNGNGASRCDQASTTPNQTPPSDSSGTHNPANGTTAQPRPLSLRAWMEANPNEPSASRETTLEYDPAHVTWNNRTSTSTDSGKIPIAAPALRQAPSAPGAQPDPQRDSSNQVDFNRYDASIPGREPDDMIPTSNGGSGQNATMRAADRIAPWADSEEGRAEITRRRLEENNAQNPGLTNGYHNPLSEEDESSEGSQEDGREEPVQRPSGLSINDLNVLAGLSINEPMRTPSDSGSVGFQSQVADSPTEERETTGDDEHDDVQSQTGEAPDEERETTANSEHDVNQSQAEDSPTEEREIADDGDHNELYD
jgi:hypothetical protein